MSDYGHIELLPDNSGTLPNGDHAVSIDGHVYLDQDVNYYLYGIWTGLAGVNEGLGEARIAVYRLYRNIRFHENEELEGREAWLA